MSQYREPEWTIENQERECGMTEFVSCGWCTHATGTHRYRCCISGRCDLFTIGPDIEFDTPCKVANLGRIDLLRMAERQRYGAESDRTSATRKDGLAAQLVTLAQKAKSTPPSCDNRNAEHFNIGDPVCVFLEGQWMDGQVVNGYRHHDGCVSYDLDQFAKKGIGCGVSVPCVMLKSEFDYFRQHRDEWLTWITAADRLYNGERLAITAMREAL